MTHFFLDSSAFGKLFIQEAGSERMTALVDATTERSRISSVLIVLEVRSAIRRRQLAGDASFEQGSQAIAALLIEAARLKQIPADSAVLEMAGTLVDTHNLRALDSTQLATAIVARNSLAVGDEIHFVGSDQKLLRAARAEGFVVLDSAAS